VGVDQRRTGNPPHPPFSEYPFPHKGGKKDRKVAMGRDPFSLPPGLPSRVSGKSGRTREPKYALATSYSDEAPLGPRWAPPETPDGY